MSFIQAMKRWAVCHLCPHYWPHGGRGLLRETCREGPEWGLPALGQGRGREDREHLHPERILSQQKLPHGLVFSFHLELSRLSP